MAMTTHPLAMGDGGTKGVTLCRCFGRSVPTRMPREVAFVFPSPRRFRFVKRTRFIARSVQFGSLRKAGR